MAAKGSEKRPLTTTNGADRFPKEEQMVYKKEEQMVYEDGFYEIEAILKKRIRKGSPQYQIKWLGYLEEQNTWEPMKHLERCSYWVNEFEKSLKASRQRRKRQKQAAAAQADGAPERCVKLTTGYLASNANVKRNIKLTTGITSTDLGPIVKISRPISSKTEDGGILVIFTTKRANGSEGMETNKFLKVHYPTLLMDFYLQNFISSFNRGM